MVRPMKRAKGKAESKNNIISSQGQINDLSLEYMAKIEKINGTYDFKKSDSGMEANLKTKIASIGYDKYKFDNFNLLATYSGNEVKVRDFSNNLLSFKADYNTEAKKLSGDLNIKRLTDEDIGLDKVNFVLENFKAKLDGDIKTPKAKIDLGTTVVTLPSKDLAKISGKLNLVGDKLIIEGVNVDNNLITGQYDIKEKLLNLKASLSENHLEKYYGLPYKNPDAKGLTNEEKNKFSSIKKVSQETINEMKRIVEQCEELYSLHNFLTIKWLDGTNTRIKKYLWLQMKYEKYKELPISISLSVEKNFSKVKYYVSFEIRDSKSSSHLLEKYHLHLDIPKRENMLYTTGNNELEDFIILKENNLELKKKIQTRELEKVKLCVCIEGNQDSTNDYYDKKIKEAIKELIPYYEYVINKIW